MEETLDPDTTELTRGEAQLLLIAEMNLLIQAGNNKRREIFKKQEAAWFDGTRKNPPTKLILVPTFSGKRNINEAVFMARQRGGYTKLLNSAGFKA